MHAVFHVTMLAHSVLGAFAKKLCQAAIRFTQSACPSVCMEQISFHKNWFL